MTQNYPAILRPSISPAQARAARAILHMTQQYVSEAIPMAKISIVDFERGGNKQQVAESQTAIVLRTFYESHGIEFYARHGVSFLGGLSNTTITEAQERCVKEIRGEEVFA